MDKNNSTKKHIEHLNAIINHEVEKPYKEMDADLVEACVELSLELQGKNFTLSSQELEEKVRKIPFVDIAEIKAIQQNEHKKTNKKKILLIAAIIAILCAVLAVFATGHFLDYWHKVLNDKFGKVIDAPVGETMVVGNDEHVLASKDTIYKNIKSFIKNENVNLLLPGKLPGEIEITDITHVKYDNTIYVGFNSDVSSFVIYLGEAIPQIIKDTSNKYETSNKLLCYIERLDDVGIVQMHFDHNGNHYTISGTSEQILLDIIENLEEYK